MIETPAQLGFKMPAEWEEHSAVWLAWPHDQISFPDRIPKVENDLIKIIKAIYKSESVELLVLNEEMELMAAERLQNAGVDISKVTCHICDYADIWLRDYGPVFVNQPQTHEQAWIKWTFNAYSNKFPELLKDNEVFFNLRKDIDKRMFEPDIVLEGGSIDINGQGLCLTTEQCLLSSRRNPGMTKDKMEKYLKDYLGVVRVIWLKQGLANDHTDGHIDEVARFTSPDTIVCAYEENEKDPNYKILKANYEQLKKYKDVNGNPFKVIKLPMPNVYYDNQKPFEKGGKAPASYTNFYIANEIVLAPIFNDHNDAKALQTLQACFPDRKIVSVDCSNLIYGGGALHCMTQQQPAV